MDWQQTLAFLTPCFPPSVRDELTQLSPGELQEIRIRAAQPCVFRTASRTQALAWRPSARDVETLAEALCGHSLYARREEIRQGYVTLRGGHRLGLCGSVEDVRELLPRLQLTGTPFSPDLSTAQLHWIIADRTECVTVESLADGIRVHENPVGVLTNNPPFDDQMFQLRNFMHLSPNPPHNHFSPDIDLKPYSRGMGAIGLPGDLSSQSRFVRAAFTKLNSLCTEEESVSQFFHILDSVSQIRGCCRLEDGSCEMTQYTSCCNASQGIYYYTTYGNRRISAVNLHREDLEGDRLFRFPLVIGEDIRFLNEK